MNTRHNWVRSVYRDRHQADIEARAYRKITGEPIVPKPAPDGAGYLVAHPSRVPEPRFSDLVVEIAHREALVPWAFADGQYAAIAYGRWEEDWRTSLRQAGYEANPQFVLGLEGDIFQVDVCARRSEVEEADRTDEVPFAFVVSLTTGHRVENIGVRTFPDLLQLLTSLAPLAAWARASDEAEAALLELGEPIASRNGPAA
jgi:hypothetical protein